LAAEALAKKQEEEHLAAEALARQHKKERVTALSSTKNEE